MLENFIKKCKKIQDNPEQDHLYKRLVLIIFTGSLIQENQFYFNALPATISLTPSHACDSKILDLKKLVILKSTRMTINDGFNNPSCTKSRSAEIY